MRKIALIIGVTSILSFPAFAEDQMLGGTYKLVSSTRKSLDTGEVVDTYGKHHSGLCQLRERWPLSCPDRLG